MPANRFLLALLCCAVFFCAGRAQQIPTQWLREDLVFLEKALFNAHPGALRYNHPDSLSRFFGRLRAQLTADSVSVRQAHFMIRLAVARVRDGHTSVLTPAFPSPEARFLPLEIYAPPGSTAAVNRYYGADTALRRGDRILAIDGIPAAQGLALARILVPSDGFSPTFGEAAAASSFARYWKLLFGHTDTLLLSVQSPSDTAPRTVRVAAMRAKDLEKARAEAARAYLAGIKTPPILYQNRAQVFYRDTLRPDLGVIRMTGFPAKGYRRFYRRCFRHAARTNMRALAIDLRFNTGGNVANMNRLLAHTLDRPVSCRYERSRRARYRGLFRKRAALTCALIALRYDYAPLGFRRYREGDLKVRERRIRPLRRNRFRGDLYVLTNGYSFSAASMTAAYLKYAGGAQVIGVETGGGAAGNCGGGYPRLRLPYSGIEIRFPLLWLNYGLPNAPLGRGVQPDHPTPYTLDDLLARRDLEMARLYDLLQAEKRL